MKEASNNRPERTFRAGPLSATIWKSTEGTFATVFEKRYKDAENKWTSTNRFSTSELATLAWPARQCFEYLIERREQ